MPTVERNRWAPTAARMLSLAQRERAIVRLPPKGERCTTEPAVACRGCDGPNAAKGWADELSAPVRRLPPEGTRVTGESGGKKRQRAAPSAARGCCANKLPPVVPGGGILQG